MMKVGISNERGAGLDYEGLHQPSTLLLAADRIAPGFEEAPTFEKMEP